MDLTTLISVVVGGLIAIIPILITNRFQSKERDKDRQEARKEAKIQAREKWIERDILQIMNTLDKLMLVLAKHQKMELLTEDLKLGISQGIISSEESKARGKILYDDFMTQYLEIKEMEYSIVRLVH